ncbi:hypothetical protein OC846_006177 [Tilletia horrida]|uniref:Uncharacterized protein n=1 Tax=Tilletia horrida TaxID=155126 RepID=A0AAN6JP81_9BASI|nr:hypothetical protein OC846_006177 [Tilletia horrida]KAK0562008.1 hypothetical protein OC861_005529 [Tilletia horrida]
MRAFLKRPSHSPSDPAKALPPVPPDQHQHPQQHLHVGSAYSLSGGLGYSPSPSPLPPPSAHHDESTSYGHPRQSGRRMSVGGGSSIGHRSSVTPSRSTTAANTTQSLAVQLNELAVAFADGLLDPDEYRILRQGIFDRMSADPGMAVPSTTAIKGFISAPVQQTAPPLSLTMDLNGRRPSVGALLSERPGSTLGGGGGGGGRATSMSHANWSRDGHEPRMDSAMGYAVDDSSSSVYESAHSHRSGGGGGTGNKDGGGGGGGGRGGGASSSMSNAATSIFSVAASVFRKNNNHSSNSSSNGLGGGNSGGNSFVNGGIITRDHRGASFSSSVSGDPRQRSASVYYDRHEYGANGATLTMATPAGFGPGFAEPMRPPSTYQGNGSRARSGSANSLRGGRTSAASSHSRPSILGGHMFNPPSSYSGAGAEGTSVRGSHRSAAAVGGMSNGYAAADRGKVGSHGTGSISGSHQTTDRKKRQNSASISNELEDRFRAARAAAVGIGLNSSSLERSPSMQSRTGSSRPIGGGVNGSGASILSSQTHGGGVGGGGGGAASLAAASIGTRMSHYDGDGASTSHHGGKAHLFSDSKSMISRVSTAASATASGLFGTDYAMKSTAEIQAEIKVVEEEGARMLDNFVALEQATWDKADVSEDLIYVIQRAREDRQSGKTGPSGTVRSASLRRSSSLTSASGWMNTIRAASRDRRKSGSTDGSPGLFSAFSFGRNKGKDKSSNKNNNNNGPSTETLDAPHTRLRTSRSEIGPSTENARNSMLGVRDEINLDGAATIRTARRSEGSRTGSMTGRNIYPPPAASTLRARGRAPPPSSYRLSPSAAAAGGGGGGVRPHSSYAGSGFSRSEVGHGLDSAFSDVEHSATGLSSHPLRRLLGDEYVDRLELEPVTSSAAASLVVELDDIDARKAAVMKRYHDRTAYLHSQLQSARIRERLMSR